MAGAVFHCPFQHDALLKIKSFVEQQFDENKKMLTGMRSLSECKFLSVNLSIINNSYKTHKTVKKLMKHIYVFLNIFHINKNFTNKLNFK